MAEVCGQVGSAAEAGRWRQQWRCARMGDVAEEERGLRRRPRLLSLRGRLKHVLNRERAANKKAGAELEVEQKGGLETGMAEASTGC